MIVFQVNHTCEIRERERSEANREKSDSAKDHHSHLRLLFVTHHRRQGSLVAAKLSLSGVTEDNLVKLREENKQCDE